MNAPAERSDAPKDADSGQRTPAFYKRRRRRSNEIGQILLRNSRITPEELRTALRIQRESGGHVGAILRRMGACDARAIAEALIEQMRLAREQGKYTKLARRARENPSIIGLQGRCKPALALACVMAIDSGALVAGMTVVWLLSATAELPHRFALLGALPLGLGAFAAFHLYGVTPPSPPDEIRGAVLGATLAFAASWLIDILTQSGDLQPVAHGAWVLGWLLSAALAPLGRGFVRGKLSAKSWWGHSVVVLGAGKLGRAVVSTLRARPQLGLKPVAILDDDPERHGSVRLAWGENDLVIEPVREDEQLDEQDESPSTRVALEQFSEVEEVPVVGGLELAPVVAQRSRINTAVIAMPELDAAGLLRIIERYAEGYSNVLVIPDLFNLANFGAPTKYLGGVLGIEVRRQLLRRGPRLAKRLMDIAFTAVIGVVISPILMTLTVLVWLDSEGGALYRQKRLGSDGIRFSALKFRTMYEDAERRLTELLQRDPLLRAEYEEFHKLTNDPRVTRVGRFLRKYSLDELPQLWNVLRGDMSLVGPRPYLEREIPEMDEKEAIILRVKPGITGIWQVTTRNESTFEERLQLDVEYVRNWSPWLDIYLLARTIPVVVGGTGS